MKITNPLQGVTKWFHDGRLHRTNGPAVVYENGTKEWYRDGKRHRKNGPAIVWGDDTKEWWINGKCIKTNRKTPPFYGVNFLDTICRDLFLDVDNSIRKLKQPYDPIKIVQLLVRTSDGGWSGITGSDSACFENGTPETIEMGNTIYNKQRQGE